MQDEPTTGSYALPEHERSARIVLDLLIHRHPDLIDLDESVREFAGMAHAREVVDRGDRDGLVRLIGAGLLHRLNRFVFASGAAIRAGEPTM